MKVPLLLALALLAVLAMAAITTPGTSQVAATPDRSIERVREPGVILGGDAALGIPCHLVVEAGPDTVVDRGTLKPLAPRQTLVGAFRYQEEPAGRMLYLYDDVQNLVGRIVNPRSIRFVGPAYALP